MMATEALDQNQPSELFEVEWQLPRQLIQGKQKVTVKHQARPGNFAGGLFGCEMLEGESRQLALAASVRRICG